MTLAGVIAYCDLLAVGVFAASGALAAAEKRLDVLGFVLFGTITGVGGGTLRDLLLQLPVFWISDVRYLWVCITVSALTWYIAPMLSVRRKILLWADAMGLALFSVLGCAKALQYDAPWIVAVVMGVMSASFGGLIRDTLLGRESVLLGAEIYVTAALVGAGTYVALVASAVVSPSTALLLAMIPAFILRAGAIYAGWRLPSYRRLGDGS
ncbi:trimeric intracellular cation channel family protein [Congregibacter litoralis]|uniref:Putative membrane protein n=1 Tax=Congregibacter litoralis KT71 TaxID=314285 RepID=A4A7Q5_9GAMM|nr:TRIC cation channel family protein [Congregibacter litoralis]EAQ97700.1 putative membrane protein [Congregibacter litoralis KT71]